jgi:DNA-binding NarL/FixJ family response regulator
MMNTILVVDDYEPWRRHLASTFGKNPHWRIVGEAADGPEAVEKALDIRPDLILLDVGLPTVNGIEAARQILARDPALDILFLSEHQSWEVAEAALHTGARGYLCKSDSGRELSPALDAVAAGSRFVAARFGGRVVDNMSQYGSTDARRHEALYYSTEALLLDRWASVAEAALDTDATFYLVATPDHQQRLRAMLEARGANLPVAISEGRYVSVGVDEALSTFMVGDRLHEQRFWTFTTSLMLRLAKASTAEQPHIVACGECAPMLCVRGNAAAAVRLEQLWDELTRTFNLDTVCGFASDACHCEDPAAVLDDMKAVHTATYAV